MGGRSESELPPVWSQIALAHATDLTALPEPPGEFEWNDAGIPESLLYSLRQKGVVFKTRSRTNPDHAVDQSKYQIRPEVYEIAAEYAPETKTLPCCNSTGIVNDGGTIRCKRCGEPHDRETAKEVLA